VDSSCRSSHNAGVAFGTHSPTPTPTLHLQEATLRRSSPVPHSVFSRAPPVSCEVTNFLECIFANLFPPAKDRLRPPRRLLAFFCDSEPFAIPAWFFFPLVITTLAEPSNFFSVDPVPFFSLTLILVVNKHSPVFPPRPPPPPVTALC